MERKLYNTLVVNDDDLDCKKPEETRTLSDIQLSSIGFLVPDLDNYDMVLYSGSLGKKVLKLKA